MASYIRFSANKGDSIKVDEDIDMVLKLWKESEGEPIALTAPRGGGQIVVNPDRIAYLREPVNEGNKKRVRVGG